MTITYIEQYNPISRAETGTDDALSVRSVWDSQDNINNFLAHVCNYKLVSELGNPIFETEETDAEYLYLYMGKFFVPANFSQLRWWMTGSTTLGAGYTNFKIIAARGLYRYSKEIVYSYFGDSLYATGTLQINSSSALRTSGTISLSVTNVDYYLYMAAQNSAASGVKAELRSIDIQLEMPSSGV